MSGWPRAVGLAGFALLAACTVEAADDDDGSSDGSLGSSCASAACDAGLVCPRGGHLEGHCAAPCDVDADCTIAAGDGYYCLAGVCTLVCADACSLGVAPGRCTTEERCVAQSVLDSSATDCLSWCVPVP